MMNPLLPTGRGKTRRRRSKRSYTSWIILAALVTFVFWHGWSVFKIQLFSSDGGLFDRYSRGGAHGWAATGNKCSEALHIGGVTDDLVKGSQTAARRKLYQALDDSLRIKGLDAKLGTQNLTSDELFTRVGKIVRPVLRKLDIPVRAIVIPISDTDTALKLFGTVEEEVMPLFDQGVVWLTPFLHATLYHASTHLSPIPASESEVNLEFKSIEAVANSSCAVHAVLERIVATPSGIILACWQVANGAEPEVLRNEIRDALPAASDIQVVQDKAIFHTTIARLVPPHTVRDNGGGGRKVKAEKPATLLQEAVWKMTEKLCGMTTVMDELWFVEEFDKLALGLGGAYQARSLPLRCQKSGGGK